MTAGPYLTIWIGPSSWLDAAGVRHDVPRHLIGVSTPYVRGAADDDDDEPPTRPADE